MAKKTMHHLLRGQVFSDEFHHFKALLSRIARLLNSRAVAARCYTNTDFHLVTPKDIILGKAARTHGPPSTPDEIDESTLAFGTLTHIENVARAWHANFIRQAWPLLQSRDKWKEQRPNVQVGDIWCSALQVQVRQAHLASLPSTRNDPR